MSRIRVFVLLGRHAPMALALLKTAIRIDLTSHEWFLVTARWLTQMAQLARFTVFPNHCLNTMSTFSKLFTQWGFKGTVHDHGERLLIFEPNNQSNYTPPFQATPEATCWLAGGHIKNGWLTGPWGALWWILTRSALDQNRRPCL